MESLDIVHALWMDISLKANISRKLGPNAVFSHAQVLFLSTSFDDAKGFCLANAVNLRAMIFSLVRCLCYFLLDGS